ncbi:SAP190 [Candida pseudojiufengensis]|uniref:SAP190 n=1 Tax=Candida pseudojiufengensis TaxID=497109 RepID=UPI002224D0B8|nr:SAP190 [Candida pseudojiufengensis]KAI5959952.1 SAP190 [Candida pseudojiufengensis]
MSGSFWKFSNGFTSLSNITTLLENFNLSQEQQQQQKQQDKENDQKQNQNDEEDQLQESEETSDDNESISKKPLKDQQYDVLIKLLDENDLLQELLSNNPMLLEFLRDENVLSMLVDIVISDEFKRIAEKEQNEQDKSRIEEETKAQSNLEKKEEKELPATPDEEKNEETKDKSESDSVVDTEKENETDSEKTKSENKSDQKDDESEESEDNDDEEDEDDEEEEELPEDKFRRRATLASEVLSADVWSLTDTVMESTSNLNKLWGVLDSKELLDINVSTHFMKIMEHLLDMKCDEMITYLIENQPNLVEKFMNHLSNPPLMDFLLKLISTDKPDNSTGIIDFLQNQNLISKLISALDVPDDYNDEKPINHELQLIEQSSAADFLKALITISANSTADNSTIGPNELTRELVSKEQMTRLCDTMLKGGYALANGVGIIIEIIRKNNSDYDILPVLYITLESHPPTGRDPIYLGHLLRVFGERISKFNELLIKDDNESKLRTPFGVIEPLGFERFKICELIAELLHCSNMALLNDNKGLDVVTERDELRNKMKEFDPISFKYNEIIVLPNENDNDNDDENSNSKNNNNNNNDTKSEDSANNSANDTIENFNNINEIGELDEEEPHANSNLTEEQIRSNPVVGDFLKIALFDTQIISNILSMFFRFPWNNFLHNVVFDIVQQVLNGSMDIGFNKFLAIDLFHSADITNKIIEGQKLCNDYETSHNGLRLGFMGHLTLIAEEVVKFVQLFPSNTLSDYINEKIESEIWEDYVNHVLYDTREKYNAILGGNNDDDEEDKDEEENTTFDEGLGEIIEEVKTGLVFHDDDDEEEEEDGNEKNHNKFGNNVDDYESGDDENKHKNEIPKKDLLDSDESESDDDDQFSNYMSQQLTNNNQDREEDELESSSEDDEEQSTHHSNDEEEENEIDDDYIDPNDDGLSYKKSNHLYDMKNKNKNKRKLEEKYASSSSSSSSSSDDDEDEDEDDVDEDEEEDGEETKLKDTPKLTRSSSKN